MLLFFLFIAMLDVKIDTTLMYNKYDATAISWFS